MEKTYNGWSNYETWLVNLHIDNSEYTNEQKMEMAKQALIDTEGDKAEAERQLAEAIKEMVENEMLPEYIDNLLLSDLLSSALQEVDFREIAENALIDLEYVDLGEAYEAGKSRGRAFRGLSREDAQEAEENDRQFSPFEFIARDLNAAVNSEEVWERFEDGVNDGIAEVCEFERSEK